MHHKSRLATKPGITGMWQVSGRSDITDFEEVVRLDTEYIENWSFGLDMKIVLKTIKVVLGRKGRSSIRLLSISELKIEILRCRRINDNEN